tara:strand:+ start:5542 stop:6891 length:1350 start_codon:yes stop_codon:yes gene_type:complete
MSKVIEYLRENQESAVSILVDYLKFPSISTTNHPGLEKSVNFLSKLMNESGIDTSILSTDGIPVVYGELLKDKDLPTLLIYGHYDVQPAEIKEGWSNDPFDPVIRNGKIYARGSGDNKGQHLAQILAVRAYKQIGEELPINIKFLIEGEEEMGSPNLGKFVSENKELLKADIACSSDGSIHPSGCPTLALGCRGLLYVELRHNGVNKDLHSGTYGGALASPFWRLLDAIKTLRDSESGKVLIPGFYDQVLPLGQADLDILNSIPNPKSELEIVLGENVDRISNVDSFYESTLTKPNFNICGFQGGYSQDGMKTIIPGIAIAKLDFRLVVDQDPDSIFEDLCEFLANSGFDDIEVKKMAIFKPSKTPADNPFVEKIVQTLLCYSKETLVYPNFGGSVPDVLFTKEMKIPSVWFPLANADTNSHGPDENLDLDLFHRGSELAVHLIEGIYT